jgi:hypothetical protein
MLLSTLHIGAAATLSPFAFSVCPPVITLVTI